MEQFKPTEKVLEEQVASSSPKRYLYNYDLEITKDPSHTHFYLNKYEIIAESSTQWVIKIGNDYFSVIDKDRAFYKAFWQKDYIFKYPRYVIHLYTSELPCQKHITRISRALTSLAEDTCFITDVIASFDLKAHLVKNFEVVSS